MLFVQYQTILSFTVLMANLLQLVNTQFKVTSSLCRVLHLYSATHECIFNATLVGLSTVSATEKRELFLFSISV